MLGANGAGKSTFLRAVAGQVRKPRRRQRADGWAATSPASPPHEIVEAGIALVPEDRGIFADLTVQENLFLGAYPRRARPCEAENMERVLSLFPKLDERPQATGAHDERRRAPDGGDRPRHDVGPGDPDAG